MTAPIIFSILTLLLALFLIVKPRSTFLFILGGLMLFLVPFSQARLFQIGRMNVYTADLIMAALFLALSFLLLHRKLVLSPRSVLFLLLLFAWGVIGIVRGLPRYSYRAIGEARWYVILPVLVYLFAILMFKSKQHIRQLVRWFLALTFLMLFHHGIDFYFLGGMERSPIWILLDPRGQFRFVGATENLLIAFVFVSLILFYVFGEIKKHILLFYAALGILLLAVVIPQTRSVWLAVAIGFAVLAAMMGVRFVCSKLSWRGVFLGNLALLLAILLPLAASFFVQDVYAKVVESASFFQDPLQDATGYWRLMGWRQEMEKAIQHPIFGDGYGGYSEWFDGQEWQQVAVHNGYIMHFSKQGILGLLLLCVALGYWYVEMREYARMEANRYYKLLGYALQICVLMNLVFAFFYDFTIFFWVLLAAGNVLVRAQRAERLKL